MSLRTALARVQQAEAALATQRDAARAQWRQLGQTWRSSWTPGRLLVAGLAAGFVLGRGRPLRLAGSSGWLRLLQSLAPLLSAFTAPTAPATDATQNTTAEAGIATSGESAAGHDPAHDADAEAAAAVADAVARVRAAGV